MEASTTKVEWLAGIKVLLLGHYVPAPFAAYLLHNLGAEVIKVEDAQGDHLRQIGTFGPALAGKLSPMFALLNAGFKSIGIQYRLPAGAALLRELVGQVDVVIDGQRAGTLARHLGAQLSDIAPHVIYIPITAYGLVGPMAQLAGHDNNVLAHCGNLSYTQTDADGLPTVFSAPVADMFAGQMAAMGALAALIGRQKAGAAAFGSQTIDASMLHAGFFLNALELAARNDPQHVQPLPGAAWMNGGRADYRPYRCSDGRFVFFGLLEPWAAKRFLKALGRDDLVAKLGDAAALRQELELLFATQPQAEWVRIGAAHDACITAVNDLETAVQDPQIQALSRMQAVQMESVGQIEVPSFPLGFGAESQAITAPQAAPLLGQHNEEVLHSLLGMSPETIATLYAEEILVPARRGEELTINN